MNTDKSQLRVRPRFILGLVVVFIIIPLLFSLLLPVGDGRTEAKILLTRREITNMGSVLTKYYSYSDTTNQIHIESSGDFAIGGWMLHLEPGRNDNHRTNSNGELLDFWQTPYRVEITVQTNFIIRSGGPNQKYGDEDDIIFNCASNNF